MMKTEAVDFYTDPYDCNEPLNESRPSSVVYTASFRELQELIREAASLLRKPLEDSKCQNGSMRGLIEEITKHTKENVLDHVKFAVVGDPKSGEYPYEADCKSDSNSSKERARSSTRF
jgi:hypothetical protein